MATDVDVQFFSHLNGLALGNNWGDLIRLLDKALVNGIDFTSITAASIDAQGDVHITLYAAHNAMLFQVVELSGFTPASLNQKYRIKGVPNATQLILKPHTTIVETSIATVGAGKLAPLGYEIIFRDANDVKRVYRAKNPTSQHPFIRVDESLSDGTNSYNSSYAKYAMVGLLEHMDHIDDYQNPDVLQLPFDPSDPSKNWKITGTGTGVVRGWSRWYYALATAPQAGGNHYDSDAPVAGGRSFLITGNLDAFYFQGQNNPGTSAYLRGCGIFNSSLPDSIIPNWFLMSTLKTVGASTGSVFRSIIGSVPFYHSTTTASFFVPTFNEADKLAGHVRAEPIIPSLSSGIANVYSANSVAALEVPFFDASKFLRGSLKHVYYNGKSVSSEPSVPTPLIVGGSVFLIFPDATVSTVIYYLGELE